MHIYMRIGKARSWPGAGCRGQPHHLSIQLATAACLGQPYHVLYTCIDTSKLKSKQPARGGLPRPAPPCVYACSYIHLHRKQAAYFGGLPGAALACLYTNVDHIIWRSKQQARGGLLRPAPSSLHTCEYINIEWGSYQPAWSGLLGATFPCPYMVIYISIGKASSRPGAGRPGSPIISLCM